MRCTRCDRIVIEQRLGRLDDGRLVFGWCVECLTAEGCLIREPSPASVLRVLRDRGGRVVRRVAARNPRQLAMLGIGGLALAWAVILAFVGGLKFPIAITSAARPAGSATRSVLVVGGGLMALLTLGVWVSLLNPSQRGRVAVKFVQVAAALTVLASLAYGIVHHNTGRDPVLILIVALGLGLSWGAHWWERRTVSVSRPTAKLR